ncbi:MAG: hypothetical protein R6V48_03580 [Fidelibacterota bacterium]
MKNTCLLFLLIQCLVISRVAAQEFSIYPAQYLHFGASGGYTNIKDAGTSPLRYQGASAELSFAYIAENTSSTWGIYSDMSYSAGFAGTYYMMNYIKMRFDTYYLKQIPQISGSTWQVQAGGSWLSNMAFTYNDAYLNASVNADFFSGPHVRGRFTYTFKRPEYERKIAFIRFRRPERRYRLIYELDLPLIIFNRRPPFSFVLNGSRTDLDIFDSHFFVGGSHLRSKLGLARYLKNGNALQLAYIWDVYTSGKRDIYRFETASHLLQCAFYFKLN